MVDLAREQLIARLAALEPAFRAEGVTRLSLIGSRARGDNRPDSDIDVLIDVEEGRKFSLLDLVGVGHVIEDEFHIPSSVVMRRSLAPEFWNEVKPDEIGIFG